MPVLSLGILYVFAVLPIAVVWGLAYSVCVSVACMLAFNFFFLPPLYTLTLADSRNWFALLVFVGTSIVVSELAARSRRRAREASLLAEIATSLLEHGTVGAELERISLEAARALHAESAAISLGDEPAAGYALTAGGRRVGTIRLSGGNEGEGARRRLLPALASLLGVAIDRERLEQEAFEAEALRRADAIKTALLRAVSHDLRTPLMAISTSAGALARPDLAIDDADRAELLATILAASNRLDQLVGNLLDLSRLQAGAAEPAARADRGRRPRRRGARRARCRRRPRRGLAARRAAGGRGRRPADPAGAREPDRERAQVLAERRAGARPGRRDPDRGDDPGRRPRPGHPRPPTASGSSSRSSAARTPARRRAPGSGSRSPAASPRPTAAGSAVESRQGQGATFVLTLARAGSPPPVRAGEPAPLGTPA